MDDRENYFDYVTGVLGIKSVLLEAGAETSAVIPLLLAVQDLATYSAPENELLEKMIGALKLDPKLIKVVDLATAEGLGRGFTVEFRDQAGASAPGTQQVFSPRTLLLKPALKKQAWEDLQKVIRHFSS